MSIVKGHANDYLTADGRSKCAKRNVGLPKVYVAVLGGHAKPAKENWNVGDRGPSGTKNATRSY
jgi:hypothetical protein